MTLVVVVRYGMGNTDSVARAVEECGGRTLVTDRPEDLARGDHVILPGVGAFQDGMRHIRERGLDEAITEVALGRGVPLLGICLGMQLLATTGEEGGYTMGLGLVPGSVRRLVADAPGVRLPHVGWNEVTQLRSTPLVSGIPDGTDFYFVHGYHLVPDDPLAVVARTPYCGGFTSVVARGNVHGVQFHPEKSQRAGFQLLRNFLAL